MLLRELQALLAKVYGLDLAADVADYLVTDEKFLALFPAHLRLSPDENLLVSEADDALEIALYLNAALLQRLTESNPCGGLSHSNLDDFCKVLEGVSHFVYLAWNAAKDKSVTRLELELQAEVDKYVSARLLLESQPAGGLTGSRLHEQLFGAVRFRQGLAVADSMRYRDANGIVSRYCSSLEQRFPEGRATAAMMQELRAFYRMPQPDKFSHMHASVFL